MNRLQRDIAVVVGWTCLLFIPFYAKPYHIDEPQFLAYAQAILRCPHNPFNALINWYGRSQPLWQIDNGCPLSFYLLAAALKLTSGAAWSMRLFFMPLDIATAVALYLIARRFLSEPLWPVLIAIAGPAYMINLNHLMGEKFAAVFGFWSLWFLLKSVQENKSRWYWISAALCALTLLAKVSSVFFLLLALIYSRANKVPLKRILLFFVISAAPCVLYLMHAHRTYGSALSITLFMLQRASRFPSSQWPDKLRSLLSFVGGCSLLAVFMPFWSLRSRSQRYHILSLLGVLLLFMPFFDCGRNFRMIDRVLGIVFSFGALWSLLNLFAASPRQRGWPFWCLWILLVPVVFVPLYWSIVSRLILFMIPPLIFGTAEILEASASRQSRRRLYAATLLASLLISVPLALVDLHFARDQERMAGIAADMMRGSPYRLWFTGHWGFQYYMDRAGAHALDEAAGGWDQPKAGDVVVVPMINADLVRPGHSIAWKTRDLDCNDPIPLRLIGIGEDQAGFHSSVNGFLPYSIARRPLDRFVIVTIL